MAQISLQWFATVYILLTCVSGLVSQPRITEAPNLARRQDVGSGFIGYVTTDGAWFPESCESGSTVSESSSYFACKPTDASSFIIATTCSSSSILIAPGTTFPCGSNLCYTMYIFNDIEDQSPHSAFACDSVSRQFSFYETTPTTTATTSLSLETLINSGSLASIRSYSNSLLLGGTNGIPTGPQQTTTTNPSSSSSSNGTVSTTTSSKKSKAWIAGPAMGGVIVIAIIAALSFWVWKLKSAQKRGQQVVYVEDKKPDVVGDGYPGMSAQQLDSRAVHRAPMAVGRAELEGGGGFER